MLLRQFCLGNNLLTQIRENPDFPQQKPQQLPSADTNFEGCYYTVYRRDRNGNGVDVPSTQLKIDPNFEAFYAELNIRKKIIMLLI